MKYYLKKILNPIRRRAAQFVRFNPDFYSTTSIIYKAANIIAAEKVEGDYLEFGVFAGKSFIESFHTLKTVFEQQQQINSGRDLDDAVQIQRIWKQMRFFAFDSFQGLPEIGEVDKSGRDFAAGKYACSEARFLNYIGEGHVSLDKVITIAGWFEDSCTEKNRIKYGLQKAAIVHVDCDLYSSTKTVLKFIEPLLNDGTIIIFDDWFCFRGNPELGEQGAFNEWKSSLEGWTFTEYQKEGPWRISFIANKLGSR